MPISDTRRLRSVVSGLGVFGISSSDVDDACNNMISCDVYDGYDLPLVMILLRDEAGNTADDDGGDQASEEEDFVATTKANANKNRIVMVVGCRG